ncbi:MAG: 50S ribosomal protein L11 methyltransferase [Rickettsiales bacterium]|nr:50S ribosomal protein L11 methyltransferase [Rickettsiales bacterium]
MSDITFTAGSHAFGDGNHPSTRGVLEALMLIDPDAFTPTIACDMGAGAGLLSFAMATRFGCPVMAVEREREAAEILKANIHHNHFIHQITPIHADGFHHPDIAARAPYDLLVMNILPEPLLKLAAAANDHLASSGVLILSGIMIAKESIIIQAYQVLELELTSRIVIGDWVTLVWQKE